MNRTIVFLGSALFAALSVFIALPGQAQVAQSDTAYVFDTVAAVPVTSVKDQHRSGTCWAFAGISFLEAEAMRIDGAETDLSEMFVVRHAYAVKALKYVRQHGSSNFGPGGQAHDVTNVLREYGLVPEEAYQGLETGEDKHDHGEIDVVLRSFLDAILKNRGGKLSPVWFEAYNAILDVYLGRLPEQFIVDGQDYDPHGYAAGIGLNPDDYVEFTSYNIYPYYRQVMLEIPDNWSNDRYYNLPVDEFVEVALHALENGYSVCWDGDVSDRGFSHKNGLAILPDRKVESMEGTERARWESLSETERSRELYSFEKPGEERDVDQEMRQDHFNSYQTTDDHLMHLTGLVKDQNGNIYFITKNSWDDDSNESGGYLNMSVPYFRLNTVAFMVHKDAIPRSVAKKIGL